MNNDVMIEDDNFLNKVEKIYSETKFHILGPNIIHAKTGQRQNPMRTHTKDEIWNLFKTYKRKSKFSFIYFHIETMHGKIERKILKSCIKNTVKSKEKKKELFENERMYNPVLHGACYICSELFINSEDALFDPRTFLYWEEYLLWIRCNQKMHTLVYDSSVEVQHLSGYATV